MSKFKVGDSIKFVPVGVDDALRIYVSDKERVGEVGIVTEYAYSMPTVKMDDGYELRGWDEVLYEAVEATPAREAEYIINGSSGLFTSMDDVEAYAKANYADGQTVEIAQVIKRVIVKRTVSISLELA